MSCDYVGNELTVGEIVVVLTQFNVGSKYKRLFDAQVIESSKDKTKVKVLETGREVWVNSVSLVRPF